MRIANSESGIRSDWTVTCSAHRIAAASFAVNFESSPRSWEGLAIARRLAATVGLALSAGVGMALVFPFGPADVAAAAFAGMLRYAYVRRRAGKRLAAFEEQLPEAIDLIGRALRAGHPL